MTAEPDAITMSFRPDRRDGRARLAAEDRWRRGGVLIFSPIVPFAFVYPALPRLLPFIADAGDHRAYQIGGAAALLLLFGGALLVRRYAGRRIERAHDGAPVAARLDAEGLRLSGEGWEERRRWSFVAEAGRDRERLVLLFRDGAARALPFAALPEGMDGEALWRRVQAWRGAKGLGGA